MVNNPWINLRDPDAAGLLARSWKAAVRREQLVRPWRRLRWLCSLSPNNSPIAAVIHESRERAYALGGSLQERRNAFQADLTMVLMAWPLLTAVLLLLTLLPLRLIYPFIDPWTGMTTGIMTGLAGGVVCAAVVSPIAVGAGSIAMGWAFGVAHAFAAGRFGFDSGPLGGAARSAGSFRGSHGRVGRSVGTSMASKFPLPVIASVLIGIAAAIFAAGVADGPPERAAARASTSPSVIAQIKGGVCGSLAGGGIGIVYGLTALFQSGGLDGRLAFPIAFALVGGTTFAVTIWLKTGNRPRAAVFGTLHAIVAITLCLMSIQGAGTYFALLALAAATAWYHATWFTGAFVVGDKLGSTRAAVTATTIEGAIGFTVFVLFRMIHG